METKHYKETIDNVIYNVTYRKNDYKQYVLNGLFHNKNGPAQIIYYSDGNIYSEEYFIKNKLHNENGPAVIQYNVDKSIRYKAYWLNGKRHNENGPAAIWYHKNGNIKDKIYSINGKRIYKITTDQELKQFLKFRNF